MRSEALIVAQPAYEQWEQLPAAAEAARELANALTKNGYAVARVDLIDGCDKHSAEQALADWFGNVHQDARLILFWTGHGTSDGGHYLICRNSPRSGLTAFNAIDAGNLGPVIANCEAEKILVILDTCYSGHGAAEIASSFSRVLASRVPAPGQERAIAVIASAHSLEKAREGIFCSAVQSVLFEPKAPRLWSDRDAYIHSEFLARAVGKLLPSGASRPEYRADGIGQDFIPNPLYSPGLVAEVVEERVWRLAQLEGAEHFDLAARGIEIGTSGWYFAGRRRLLGELVTWLNNARQNGVRIVTGPPGSGKSAVMGRLATLSDPECRQAAMKAGVISSARDPTVPPEGIIDVAIHAKGKTLDDSARAVALALALSTGKEVAVDVEALVTAVGNLHRRVSVIVDGLDEAASGHARKIADSLIVPLSRLAQVRILVGCRRSLDGVVIPAEEQRHSRLRAVFGAEAIIDDLEDERDTKEDIAEYVRRRLATSPKHHNRPNAIAVAAGRVADQADGVFLYARIVSRTLQESDRLDSALPGTALEAFAHDLRARFGADEQRVDDLLAALAWGEGKGLTRRVWPRIANELARRKRVYDDDDVTWALDHAGWHIIEAGEGGQAVYRLGHQALADNYRGRSEAAKAQDRIVSALTKNIVGAAWLDTDHYLWRHLADHAAQAGRLDILIQDPGYLAVADPARLTAMLPNIRDSRGRAFANIYIRVADRLINQPPLERLSLIHLTAQMDAPNLAVVLDPPTFVRWRASWAKVRPDTPHRTIGRHDTAVSCVSIITADQRPMLISSDDEGSVRFWDARTGEEAGKTLKVSSEGIRSFVAATLEDSDVLFVESDDGALRLWDTQVGKLIASPIERAAGVLSVTSTLNFDHLFFLQTEGSAILCADPATRKAAWKVLSHEVESISSVAFDASENELIELNIADFVRVEAGVADDSKMTIGPHAFLLTDEATRPAWLTDEPRRPAYIFVGNEDGTITVHAADRLGTEPMKSGRITVVNAKAEQMVATIVRDKSSDDWNVYSWNRVATNIFRGHRSRITAIFIARINRRRLVFSGDEDGSILMWDALSRALVGEFPKPTVVAGISLLRLAELDGATILISGRMNGTVQFWEVQQQRELKTLSPFHASPIVTAEIGEMSGRTLFIAGNLEGQIRLWDLKTNTLFGEGPIWRSTILGQLALGKLGHRSIIATRSSRDDDFKVLDMLTGQHICSIVKSRGIATKRIQAEHNGVALEAVARADATIVLVDKRRNRLIGHPLIGHSAPISSLACGLIDDHLVLASGGTDQTIRIWYIYNELEAYRSRHAFTYRIAQYRRFLLDRWRSRRLHAGAVNSVALMQSSGGWIAVSGGNDRSIRAWNVTSGRNIKTLRNYHYAPVTSVSICSIDTKPLIATAGEDGRVLIWDETFRDVLKYIPKLWSGIKLERIKTVIVCEIGNIPTVVSCGQIWSGTFDQGTIGLWDVRTAYQRGFLPRKLFDTSTVAVGSMGNDQVVIAAGEDGIIRLWDCRTGELVGKPLNGHAGPVNSLDFGFADNQRIVASGGRDRTVRIWNLEADEPVSVPIAAHNGAVKSVSLDRAGKVKIVVSGGEDKTIRITSIRSQKELLKIELGSEVFCVAFNSDVGILAGISTGVVLLKIENMLSEL